MRALKHRISRNSSRPVRSSSALGAGSRWDGIRWAGHGYSAQTDAAGLTTAGGTENE